MVKNYFLFGGSLHVINFAFIAAIQNLNYKLAYSAGFLILKIVLFSSIYAHAIDNLLLELLATICMVILFVYQEIIARKNFNKNQKRQTQNTQNQNLLYDNLSVGILIITPDFQTLYSNLFFEKQFQFDDLYSLFKNIEIDPHSVKTHETFTLPTLLSFLETFNAIPKIARSEEVILISAKYKNPTSGHISDYQIKILDIKWNNINSYSLIFTDVSPQQENIELRLADQQKDKIIATVAHELRTPINATLGLLDMADERIEDKTTQTFLKHAKSCNKLLLYLVNSILDLSQIKQNTLSILKELFSVDEFLEEFEFLYMFQCQAKGIQFFIERDGFIPKQIYTDRHRLIEVLINLIGNAIKFTFHGSVTLRIALDEESRKLQFSVIDTGIGVKKEDCSKLFSRFGKIKQEDSSINKQGVGLGLTIVQELVIALNNNDPSEFVKFESEYGKGSIFSFNLSYKKDLVVLAPVPNKNSKTVIPTKTPVFPETDARKNAKASTLFNPTDNSHKYLVQRKNDKSPTVESPIFPPEFDQDYDSVTQKLKKYEPTSSGSNFSQRFLLRENSPLAGENEFTRSPSIRKGRKLPGIDSVLIVDDNPFNILAANFVLDKLNCQVDKAFHGQECLNILQKGYEQGKYYELILMDIHMPILDGPTTSKIISEKIEQKELNKLFIIGLTAKKCTEEEIKYYESCGMHLVLEKPLNEAELVDKLQDLVNLSD